MNFRSLRLPRLRTRLTREGWYYLGVLAFVLTGSMLREINLMLVLAGMMLGPLLLSRVAVWLNLRRLQVHRKIGFRVSAGDPLTIEVAVSSGRRRGSSWALWIDDPIRSERSQQEVDVGRALLPSIPAGQERSCVYRRVLARRGRYLLGPIRVSSRFPLGLLQRTKVFSAPDSVVVYPRLGRLTSGAVRLLAEMLTAEERGSQRRAAAQGDFFGVREWQPGDSRRAVHWRTTARRGAVMVRQFEQPGQQDLAVLLDLWSPIARVDSPDVEQAIRFVASLATEICRRRSGELVVSASGENGFYTSGAATPKLAETLLEKLALVEASTEGQPRKWLQLPPSRRSLGVVAVTTRPFEQFRRMWSEAVQRAESGLAEPRVFCLATPEGRFELTQYFDDNVAAAVEPSPVALKSNGSRGKGVS